MKKGFTIPFLVTLVALFVTTSAFCDEGGGGWAGKGHGRCDLKLSADQKAKMKSEHFKFAESRIDLEAQLKHAKLAYAKLMSDPDTDYRTAKAAQEQIAKDLLKLITARQGLRTEIAFKIFTPEQRTQAAKCGFGRHHRFGRGGFGPGRFQPGFGGPRAENDQESGDEASVALAD